jgi:ATP-binding cassette subfamily B protein RaxB
MLDTRFTGRSRLRLVRQTESAECGLACLVMVANFHGLNADFAAMRRRFGLSMRGTSLRSLIDIADQIGLISRAVRAPLEELHNLALPAVLHWNMNHFVVVERVHRGRALIHDPAGRTRWMPMADVSNHFTGIALELRPGDSFEPGPDGKRLRLRNLWERMTGMKRTLAQTLILSFVLQAFVLASPYYMQVAIDNALPALDYDLLTVVAIGFVLFTLINAGAALLRGLVLLNAGTSIGLGLAVNVARRLLRLPISWFSRRHTGDVLSRFQSIVPIQQMLTEGAAAAVVDGLLAVLTLVVMSFYSLLLTSIAVGAFLLYGAVRIVSFSFQREAQESSIVTSGKEQTALIESLRGIATLRLFGQESLRHALWQSKRTEAANADVRLARFGVWQGVANSVIFGLENVVSIWIAVGFVMAGSGFSVGMVFAFLAYKTQFIQKSENLVAQAIRFRMLGLHLERLSDIALTEEDKGFQTPYPPETELDGAVALSGIEYRYSAADPAVLRRVDLEVVAGEHVAITGPSGGGKTTLIKILLGLIEPDSGEMLIDGVPLPRFGYRNYRRQIAGVLQEDTLFAGTLAENIAFFDEHLDMDRVTAAAADAVIHDDIMSMPMQYETAVGEMGSTLSGGQKQRVLLARALYRKPRILIMDEGTAHLDASLEEAVNRAIRRLGITRIVVAHRQETIRAADRILHMENGRLRACEVEGHGLGAGVAASGTP